MKARTLLVGAAIGTGAYLAFSGKGRHLMERAGSRLQSLKERRAEKHLTPAQTIQDERATEEVADMLDDVVHRDDIPETEVKHAFEQAVHNQVHHP